MNERLNIRIRQNISCNGWELFAWQVDWSEKVKHVAQPLTMEAEADGMVAYPFARITQDAAQQLMDDLWLNGLRPSKRLLEEVPLDHLKGEVEWNRSIIERLLPGRKR